MALTIRELQEQTDAWRRKNFPKTTKTKLEGEDIRQAFMKHIGNRPYSKWSDAIAEAINNGELHLKGGLESGMGVAEEVGEMCHLLLKGSQGIREGTGDMLEWDAKLRDSLGDTFIYMLAVATWYNIDLQTAIEDTWKEVSARDWTVNKVDGMGIDVNEFLDNSVTRIALTNSGGRVLYEVSAKPTETELEIQELEEMLEAKRRDHAEYVKKHGGGR